MAGNYLGSSKNRRKPRKKSSKHFFSRFFPAFASVLLMGFCAFMLVLTVQTLRGTFGQTATDPLSTGGEQLSSEPTETTPVVDMEAVEALLSEAEGLAGGYDYLGAIELLQTFEGYEQVSEITDAIDNYTQLDSELITYNKMDTVTHIFFHSLIVDTDRAFDGDYDEAGYNLYMATVDEFEAILQQMYDRGYILVSPYDVAYEVTDESGTHFVYGTIRIPEGKTPFMMSQDDVNYYSYMVGTGDGKNETPIFADATGDGFASRIVIGEDGYPTCEYVDADGNTLVGAYDLVPILENFIQEHPDFSYHGARAILGVTGYEGVFGYRTKPSYEDALGSEAYAQEVEAAKEVAQCLKDHGWILASHTYGHPNYSDISAERIATDMEKWLTTVGSIIGDTDILIYPYGGDISGVTEYNFTNDKYTVLYEAGFRYFFNVDSKVYWCQLTETSYRAARRNIDGYRMWYYPEKLSDLFDVDSVFDAARPTPVPDITAAAGK